MRLRKIKNAKEKLEAFSDLVKLNPESYKGSWNKVFNNDNPIYLEVGMGKGKFIKENAIKNPNINYIGCEISESIMLKAARNLEQYRLNNLLLININANQLNEVFGENEISKLFLNFSDPWPKNRHSKRRLTSSEFLKFYKSILKEDGIIEFKTDNRNLFEFSLLEFNSFGLKFEEISLNLHENQNDDIITTEYEEKFKSLGNIIYYIKVGI